MSGEPVTCLDCRMTDPPPEQSCKNGLDHRIGAGHPLACSWCGRLSAVCAERPCTPEPGGSDEGSGENG